MLDGDGGTSSLYYATSIDDGYEFKDRVDKTMRECEELVATDVDSEATLQLLKALERVVIRKKLPTAQDIRVASDIIDRSSEKPLAICNCYASEDDTQRAGTVYGCKKTGDGNKRSFEAHIDSYGNLTGAGVSFNDIHKFLSMLAFIAIMSACNEKLFDDISFLETASSPAKMSALFDITQDNTGLVTITPNGEGVATFSVNFGDGTATPATVDAGKSVQHKYAEGLYTVKLVGKGVTGKVTESTQELTVSFKAPENVEMNATIDPANPFKVNVSAKATYETLFKVYFGDVANEVPVSFLEGETISHTYTAVGNYEMKVVALSGGKATTEVKKTMNIVSPVVLPLDFETAGQTYKFNRFEGGDVSVIANPQVSGINTSAKVAKMVKYAGQTYGGSLITLGGSMDFSVNKYFSMKVFYPRVGAKVLLKVENASNGSQSFEKEVTTTKANVWE